MKAQSKPIIKIDTNGTKVQFNNTLGRWEIAPEHAEISKGYKLLSKRNKKAQTPTHGVYFGEIYGKGKIEEFIGIKAAKSYAARKASEMNLPKKRGYHWSDETTFVRIEKI
jgi:hypothetical protein